MKYYALLLLALMQVLLSIVLGYKRGSRTSKWFITFSITLAVWTLFNVLLDYHQYYGHGSIGLLTGLNKLGFFTGTLSLLAVYRLTLVFPLEKKIDTKARIITLLGLLLPFASSASLISGSFAYDGISTHAVYTYGSAVPVIGIFSLILVIFCIINIFSASRGGIDDNIRHQATTLFTALLTTIIFAILFITVIPAILPSLSGLVFVGYFAPYIFTTAMLYSIFRQRFLNFRSIVARSMAYILSLLTVSVIYVVLLFKVINNIFFKDAALTWQQASAYIIFTIFVALTFPKIQTFFDRISNKMFYRDAYDPQAFIDKLNRILVGTYEIGPLARKTAKLIEETLKAGNVQFLLFNSKGDTIQRIGIAQEVVDKDLERTILNYFTDHKSKVNLIDDISSMNKELYNDLNTYDVNVITKLVTRKQQIGFLILGPKKSGNSYDAQDLHLFSIIADQLAIAFQNSLRFEEIESFNITLQQKVEDATRELRKTNEKLKALDEAKDEFISMASHQLRTPLTSVKGYVSMVLEGDAGKITTQQKKLLEQAFSSSQRMVYLIADLLNVSRLKTGKFVIEAKPAHLPNVIEDEVLQLKESIDAHELELTFNKPDNFPMVNIDETKTRQVIMNFIDNAIYYTPAGGHINVELTATDRAIEFKVVDDGIGVPKAEQPHLFTKFYRADNAKKARPDGTGLGLYMAQKVIVAQGGAIIFSSQENKGSTFGFTLPLHTSHEASPA